MKDSFPCCQTAAGMGASEIFGTETARLEQRDSESVTHGEGGSGAGRGRETQGTGLLFDANIDIHVGPFGHARLAVPGKGDQRYTQALDERQNGDDLTGTPGVGNSEDDIVGR